MGIYLPKPISKFNRSCSCCIYSSLNQQWLAFSFAQRKNAFVVEFIWNNWMRIKCSARLKNLSEIFGCRMLSFTRPKKILWGIIATFACKLKQWELFAAAVASFQFWSELKWEEELAKIRWGLSATPTHKLKQWIYGISEQWPMNNTHDIYCTIHDKFYHRKYMLTKKNSNAKTTDLVQMHYVDRFALFSAQSYLSFSEVGQWAGWVGQLVDIPLCFLHNHSCSFRAGLEWTWCVWHIPLSS